MSIKTKIKRLAIIGVGLIGGSFGVSLRYRGAVEEIVGYGRNIKNLGLAKELGLIDRWTTNIDEAVSHADIVLIATPVGAMPAVFDLMKDAIAPECIITDVGSVKQVITEAFKNSFLDQINQQYVITAKSKGLSERKVLYGHVFRNAMLIVIAGFPSAFIGILFSSSLFIEVIFSLDGLGLLGYEAALSRDYPVIFATLYFFSLLGLIMGIIGDVMYSIIDPRIDFESREIM